MNASTIRQLVVTALTGNTTAGSRVYSPRDWATSDDDYPVILVTTPYEEKHSMGRNAPQFTSVATVRISGRTETYDSETIDGATQAYLQLETLREEIDTTVINSYDLTRQTQQFKHIRSHIQVDAEGNGHIGQLTYEIDIEYFQGPEDFYPTQSVPLETISLRVNEPTGTTQTGFDVSLSQ